MNFTLEEQNNKINFLNITITRKRNGLTFEIYGKPTAPDIIIPNESCHPREHKTAAIRYYYNRMKTYHLTPENRQKERDNIQHILLSNKYNESQQKFNKGKGQKRDKPRNKWAKFIYIGKDLGSLQKCLRIQM
jgi:hypothetical protein